MASTASASSVPVSTAPTNDLRPQAGPLPSKPGEIGYREDLPGQDLERGVEGEDGRSVVMPLPERHPADRDAHEAAETHTDVPLTPAAVASSASQTAAPSHDSSSTHSMGKRSIIKFLTVRGRKIPSYGGIRLTTFLLFIMQIILMGGTIAGWILTVERINQNNKNVTVTNTQDGSRSQIGSGSTIFIHVVFAVIFIGEIILFERRVYRLRAERYAYVHPGEILPSSRRPSNTSMGIAPWHRPPLPTYAAALAQSGHGTGDVEDNVIAVPPPPAYGHTRDSRLLLSGFLRNSLRAQRPVSEHSQMSQQGDRPLSYVSNDEQWQEIQDAERARELEEALSTLETEGTVPTASTSVAQR